MKHFLWLTLFLVGCSCTPVKEEVWTTPKFDIPKRPVLVSDGKGTDGEIARKNSEDLVSMRMYTFKLENILISLKTQSTTPPAKNVEINK